jgi:hypothetical protein
MPNRQLNSLFLSPVSNDELLHCIHSLSNKKSCDLDGLSVVLLKKIAHSIVLPLTIIINKSFSSGIVPQFCKIARVIPLYKSGDKSDYHNYRPILFFCIF